MKKRRASLLALVLCVCMAGTSLTPASAAEESPAPVVGEQTADTMETTDETVVPADEEPTGTPTEPSVTPTITPVDPTAAPTDTPADPTDTPADPTLAPTGSPVATESPQPSQTPGQAEEDFKERTAEAKAVADAREREGGPKVNEAYSYLDVTFEDTTATDPATQISKAVKIMKVNGSVPTDPWEKIIGVLQQDGTVVYYAYYPRSKKDSVPAGAICVDDVYKFSVTNIYYAFDEQGRMVISGTYVYKSSANQNTFYFQKNGQKKSVSGAGCYKVEGTYYYLTESGAIKKSVNKFIEIDGDKYYFENGVAKSSSFVTVDSYRYYLDENGRMVTGRKKIDGDYYYFLTDKEAKGKKVGSAVSGWHKRDDWWYYYTPKTYKGVTGYGIVKLSKNSFYFYPNGRAYRKGGKLKNKYTGGKAYYFRKQTDTQKPAMLKSTWISDGKKWYYALANGQLATGKQKITTKKGRSGFVSGTYFFDESNYKMLKNTEAPDGSGWLDDTGRLVDGGWLKKGSNWQYISGGKLVQKGWQKIDGYYYYFKGGALCQDLREKYKNRSGSNFRLEVNRKTCTVTVFTKSTFNDETNGKFVIPVVVFRCSVGLPGTPTPTGEYHAWRAADNGRWKLLNGPTWGQYALGVVNNILFHSVPGPNPQVDSVPRAEYNRLGAAASHGCIRLCVNDEKWLWDHANGASVRIFDNATDITKFAKPSLVKMAGTGAFGVDPTDPSVSGWVAPKHINPY